MDENPWLIQTIPVQPKTMFCLIPPSMAMFVIMEIGNGGREEDIDLGWGTLGAFISLVFLGFSLGDIVI